MLYGEKSQYKTSMAPALHHIVTLRMRLQQAKKVNYQIGYFQLPQNIKQRRPSRPELHLLSTQLPLITAMP